MSTRIKLSGVVRAADAEVACRLGVDMVACVFYARSPRYVTTEQVWEIRRALAHQTGLVGIFVDAPAPLVQRLVDHCRLDGAQLFGAESRAVVESIRPHAFKAVNVDGEATIEAAQRAFLTRRAGAANQPLLLLNLVGAADGQWSLVAGATRRGGVVLTAAALTPDTVGAAIATARPWAVDVWSAVEARPGEIDPHRLADFVAAVRAVDGTD